jgi:hypothetical protein
MPKKKQTVSVRIQDGFLADFLVLKANSHHYGRGEGRNLNDHINIAIAEYVRSHFSKCELLALAESLDLEVKDLKSRK